MSTFDILQASGRFTSDDCLVLTDRSCGIEEKCAARGIRWERLKDSDAGSLSRKACTEFQGFGCDLVLLYFLRLVTTDLFRHVPTVNIHPSLLPAFRGFRALERALNAGVRFVGATLHQVIEKADSGPILAQAVSPITHGATLADLEHASYVQKTYLGLCAHELLFEGKIKFDLDIDSFRWMEHVDAAKGVSPLLGGSDIRDAFAAFQESHGIQLL